MNNTLKNILLISSGVAAGAIAGILTAPKSGKETREDIKDEVDRLRSKLNDLSGETRKKMESKIDELKESLRDMEAQMNN